MTKNEIAQRLQSLFPGFDHTAFEIWWVTEQPLLNALPPSQADPEEIANLVIATEKFHASKKGADE